MMVGEGAAPNHEIVSCGGCVPWAWWCVCLVKLGKKYCPALISCPASAASVGTHMLTAQAQHTLIV